jgi:hypothetical protein
MNSTFLFYTCFPALTICLGLFTRFFGFFLRLEVQFNRQE